MRDVTLEDINEAINELNSIDKNLLGENLKLSGVSMNKSEINNLIFMLSNNLQTLKDHLPKSNTLNWEKSAN